MQYELWAKKRPIEGTCQSYERLEIFYDKSKVDYMLGSLDKEVYQEAIVLQTEWQRFPAAVAYVEFPENNLQKRLRR